jgi:tetratricopeptide (TPR) repeat protein
VSAAAALTNTTCTTARRLLDALASVHLLAEIDRDRYHFHDLIRTYAAESADAEETAGERSGAEQRLLDWYLHTTIAARHALYPQLRPLPVRAAPTGCRPLSFDNRAEAVRWYDIEHDNLLAAVHYAVDSGRDKVAWQLPASLSPFLSLRSRWVDKIAVLEIGLAAARRAADRAGEFLLQLSFGEAYCQQLKRFDEGMPHLQGALEIAETIGDDWGQGQVLIDLGHIALELKDFEKAIDHFQRGINLLRSFNDQRGEALCLVYLASALRHRGQLVEAIDHALRGLTIFRNTNNRWNEAFALATIGTTFLEFQQFDQAIDNLQLARAAYRTLTTTTVLPKPSPTSAKPFFEQAASATRAHPGARH